MRRVLLLYATALLVVAAIPVEQDDACPGNQNVLVYFGIDDPEKLSWDHVRSSKELAAALLNNNNMIVIDVTHDPEKDDVPITFENITLSTFLEQIKSSGKQKGVKMNIKTREALDGFAYQNSGTRQRQETQAELGIPLWFHVNLVKFGGQADDSVIEIADIYNNHKAEFECYTFSFGWGSNDECNPLTSDDVTTMKTESDKISTKKRTFVIDATNLEQAPNNLGTLLKEEMDTLTLLIDEQNIHCSQPKVLQGQIDVFKGGYAKRIFVDLSQPIKTHMALCKNNQDLREYFKDVIGVTKPDLTALKWDYILYMDNMKEEYEANVLEILLTRTNGTLMGPADFNHFMTKFMELQKGKALELQFANQLSYDLFWTASIKDLSVLELIPIRIHLHIKTDTATGIKLNYERNRWLDCYELLVEVMPDGFDPYQPEHISGMQEYTDVIENRSFLFWTSLLQRDPKVIQPIIDQESHVLMFKELTSRPDDDFSQIRKYIFDNTHRMYLAIPDDLKAKIYRVDTVRFFQDQLPGLKKDFSLLRWHPVVDSERALRQALNTENDEKHVMALNLVNDNDEVVVETNGAKFTLEDALDIMKSDEKHGIALHFKSDRALELALDQKLLAYLNFPVWIRLDVIPGKSGKRDTLINLDSHLKKLNELYLNYIFHCVEAEGCEEHLPALAAEGDKLKKNPRIYPIHISYVTENMDAIYEAIYWKTNNYMLIYSSDGDVVYAEKLRDTIGKSIKFFADVPNRIIFDACPKYRALTDYFPTYDLSSMQFSQYIKSEEDLTAAINEENLHMIRAEVVEDGGDIYIGDKIVGFTFVKFLKQFKEGVGSDKKKGIVFRFPEEKDFEAVASIDELKLLNHPIWFDIDILKFTGPTPVFKVNYERHNDVIDCRFWNLGWILDETFSEYTEENLAHMRSLTLGEDNRIYKIRAEFLATSWEVLLENEYPNVIIVSIPAEETAINTKKFREIFSIYHKGFYFDFPESRLNILKTCPPNQDAVRYFGLEDLSQLEIGSYVKSANELVKLIESSDKIMIKVKVIENKEELYIEDPSTDFKLSDFFQTFKANVDRKTMGIIVTFPETKDFTKAMQLGDDLRDINLPLWIDVEVAKGPGGNDPIIQVDYSRFNHVTDCRTFVLGWKTSGNFKNYTTNNVEDIMKISVGEEKKIYSIRAEYIVSNWKLLMGLIEDGSDKFLAVLPETDPDDLITRDFRKFTKTQSKNLYLDIPKDKRYIFEDCPVPEHQDVFAYFSNLGNLAQDLSLLNISRPIFSEEAIEVAIEEKRHMISAVVNLVEDVPKIGNSTTFTLKDLLTSMKTNEGTLGLKLHFASTEAFDASLRDENIYDMLRNIERPIWLSANIIESNGPIDVKYMKNNNILDCRTLSLGWVAADRPGDKYTEEEIKEMRDVKLGSDPKTYLVNARYVENSWPNLNQELLSGEGNTLTIWMEESQVDEINYEKLQEFLKQHPDKIFHDMPAYHKGSANIAGLSLQVMLMMVIAYIFV